MTRVHRTAIIVAAATVLGTSLQSAQGQERTVDPQAVSTRTCQALIIDSVAEELPKAKNIEWDMESARETQGSGGVRLTGEGHYRGGSSRRTFDFECTYDSGNDEVVDAWWVSSFDRKRHVVVEDRRPSGLAAVEVGEACLSSVEQVVRDGFPSRVSRLELIEDTLDLAAADGTYELNGEGRFRGGGGNWHRFEFACSYDEDEAEVTDASWRHLGDERDLD